MSTLRTKAGDDGTLHPTSKSSYRKARATEAKLKVRQLHYGFACTTAKRLDAHPQGTHSNQRTKLVLDFLFGCGIAEPLEAKLLDHPGEPCSYSPVLVLAAIILAVMCGRNGELADGVSALNALPPLIRLKYGIYDKDGNFVGYASFEHQYMRVSKLLNEGFIDEQGREWNTEILLNLLLQESPTINKSDVLAVAVDGYAIESWARKKVLSNGSWVDQPNGLYQGRATAESPEQEWSPVPNHRFAPRRKWDKTITTTKTKSVTKRLQIVCKDGGARYGYRTETEHQKGKFIAGISMYLAAQVPYADWHGDPNHISIGEQETPRFVGMVIRSLDSSDGPSGVELMRYVKERFPACSQGLFDRGFSKATYKNFRGPINDLGISPGFALDKGDAEKNVETLKVPLKRRGPDGEVLYETYLLTAGTLLHKLTPDELLVNPLLNASGTPERAEEEAFYARRSAYSPPIHEQLVGGAQRRRCPVHAGRLRPLDLQAAANKDVLEMPALRHVDGVTECCCQQVVEVSAELLGKLHQNVPFGTPAWSKSYSRRLRVESVNALLRTNLLRVERGFCKTLDPAKYELIYGLTVVAVNLLTYERHAALEVEVFDVADHLGIEIRGRLDEAADGEFEVSAETSTPSSHSPHTPVDGVTPSATSPPDG
jgi:hypothetical protein